VEKAWLPGKVIYFPRKLNAFSFFAIWRTVDLLNRGATTPTTKQILRLLFLCYGEQNRFFLRDFLVTTYLEVLKPNTGGSNPETVSSSERGDRSLANFRTLFARYNNTGGGSHRLSLLHRLDKQGQGRQQSERSLVLLLQKKHGLMISFV